MKQANLGNDAFFFLPYLNNVYLQKVTHTPTQPSLTRVTLLLMGENSLLKVDFL